MTSTRWRSGRGEGATLLHSTLVVVEGELPLLSLRGSANGRLRATRICKESKDQKQRVCQTFRDRRQVGARNRRLVVVSSKGSE
jgi:hypothetical protein